MTTAVFGGAMKQARRAEREAPTFFCQYLLDGEHFRVGRRLRGEDEQREYTALQLHRSGNGTDGQSGPRQFTTAFLEQLEQGVLESRIEKELPAARWRYGRVQDALRAVCEDCPDLGEALSFYVRPQGPRRGSVVAAASKHNVDPSTWREWALKACGLVWLELGGVW